MVVLWKQFTPTIIYLNSINLKFLVYSDYCIFYLSNLLFSVMHNLINSKHLTNLLCVNIFWYTVGTVSNFIIKLILPRIVFLILRSFIIHYQVINYCVWISFMNMYFPAFPVNVIVTQKSDILKQWSITIPCISIIRL